MSKITKTKIAETITTGGYNLIDLIGKDDQKIDTDGVKGKRSPRWAFWAKLNIPCEDGETYLFRLRIVQTPLFGIYLHDIYNDDGDRHPHNHPWSFVSIVLRGYYVEEFYPYPNVSTEKKSNPIGRFMYKQKWDRFSVHRMGRDTAHHIIEAGPNLKTLIITGPRRGSWGFFTEEGFVSWKEYKEPNGNPV